MSARLLALLAAGLVAAGGAAGAVAWRAAAAVQEVAVQRVPRASGGGAAAAPDPYGNPPYDGRFTFARVRFDAAGSGWDFGGRDDRKWDHDFPRAERNFARILAEVTAVRPRLESGVVLSLDDPELFRYPVLYLCEPGFWAPTDAQAAALRAHLTKGGFIVFDDFFGSHWVTFTAAMRKVLPEGRLVQLDASHPVFDSFYHIEALNTRSYGRRSPEFWGIFEDNDPARRLLAVANFNNDIGENWEWSDAGIVPLDVSNQAYKLGVNYVVYGMTR